MDLNSLVQVSKQQVSCTIGDEVAILGLKTGIYYGLNSTGACVWALIQQPIRVRAICALIEEEFDVLATVAEQDVSAVLQELAGAQLLEIKSERATPIV